MNLSQAAFDQMYDDGRLKIALIGMSNIGKSYSALRLAADFDFTLIEVDKLIWEDLGESSMEDFAAWQGQPFSDGYAAREKVSIGLETQATRRSLQTQVRNPLLDTTGSVIYTEPSVLRTLKAEWYTVYIKAADVHLERLKSQYFAQPKPLAWAGHFRKIDGLSDSESLLECYPDLLAARAEQYQALADHTVSSAAILTDSNDDLFKLIRPAT